MATTAHAIRLTIHAVAPMATVATNAKHSMVSDLAKLNVLLCDCVLYPCLEELNP